MLPASPITRSLLPAGDRVIPTAGGSLLPGGERDGSAKLILPEHMRKSHNAKPINIFFWARRGHGKTLSMVMLARILKRGFKSHKSHWRILSNFWIQFADLFSPYLIEDLTEDPFQAQDSVVILDEITSSNPSRRAMSRLNIDMARFIEQIRKLRCEIMFSTQFPTEVDKSLLRQVDLFILTEAHIHPYARVNPVLAAKAYIDWYVFDYWGQFTGRFIPPQWPPPLWMADKKMRLLNLPSVWGQYESGEFIRTAWGSDAHQDRVVRRQYEDAGVGANHDNDRPKVINRDMLQAPAPVVVDPTTFEGWLETAERQGHGRVRLSKEMVNTTVVFNSGITSFNGLIEAAEKQGYVITKNGRQVIAQKPKG